MEFWQTSIFGIHLIICVCDGPCVEAHAIEDGPTDIGVGLPVILGFLLNLP